MKIIFSRKGIDSGNAGVASPIFPGGRICSIPIPSRRGKYRYSDIRFDGGDLGKIVEDLTRNKKKNYLGSHRTHFDPDLRKDALPSERGWLPAFGPSGPAETHLAKNGVEVGDLFLFFGWFRRVRKQGGHYEFVPKAPDIHLLFGWLQIGTIYRLHEPEAKLPSWGLRHAEVSADHDLRDARWCGSNWALYVADAHLHVAEVRRDLPGGGVFEAYDDRLCLTEPGKPKGHWRLPSWMYPSPGRKPLTFHAAKRKWRKDGKWAQLETVDRGQEFVLDCTDYPQQKVREWLADLFQAAT